jgi:DNA-binding GntR family transcriptional regulator
MVPSGIKFRSLTDQIYEYLSELIIEGKIKAGEKLLEKDLAQKFNVSRSPLRECFRILEAEGLIIINPRKGTYVRDFSRKDVVDVFLVRAKLESLAAKLAVQNITEKDIATFNELIINMDKAIMERDARSFFESNVLFHNVFIKASNNQVLEKTLTNLRKGIWLRITFLYFYSPLALDLSNKKHKEIVEAFIKKDPAAVERLVEEHIEHTKDHVLSQLPVEKQLLEA